MEAVSGYKRGNRRPQKKWLDTIESDTSRRLLCIGDVKDRDMWRSRTKVADFK